MDIYNVNGKFISANETAINIHDLSLLRGYGAFDFLRTYNGIPFHLIDHLKRLKKSCRLLDLELDLSIKEMEKRVMKTLKKNDHVESNIRIVVTGGESSDNLMPEGDTQVIIMVTPIHNLPDHFYSEGVKITTSNTQRFLPGAKSNNYIPAILMLKEAKAQGAIEAIFTSKDGNLLEGTTSNLFAVFGNTLVTPPEDRILPGITRQVIMKLAGKITDLEVRNIHQDEIRGMDEAFITASNKEIIPVNQINAVTIGNGKLGKITRQVMKKFARYAQDFRN